MLPRSFSLQRRVAAVLAVCGLAGSAHAQSKPVFARSYSQSGNGAAVNFGIDPSHDSGLLLSGFELDSSSNQIAAATKLDAVGNVEWRRTYSQFGGNTTINKSVALPNEETLLVGQHHDFAWVMKVDRLGLPVWQKTTASREGSFQDVIYASDGSIYATGWTNGTFGHPMFALAKLDLAGNLQWQQGYGNRFASDISFSIAEAHDGGLVMSGTYNDRERILVLKTDTDGRRVWSRLITAPPNSLLTLHPTLTIAPNGEIMLASGRTLTGSNDDDMWAMRLDSQGFLIWNQRYNRGIDTARAIASYPGGDTILAGTSEQNGDKDFLVLRLDASGFRRSAHLFGGPETEVLNDMCVLDDGTIALTGFTEGFNGQFWVVRLDGQGEVTPGFPYVEDAAVSFFHTSNDFETLTQTGSDFPPQEANTSVIAAFSSLDQQAQAATNAGSWIDLGEGLAGTEGVPHLAGAGNLRPGSYVGLVASNMRKNSGFYLYIGFDRLDADLFGGTFVVLPSIALDLPTTPKGHFALHTEWPDLVPPGVSVYMQALVIDLNAPEGFAFSNALELITP